MHDTGDDLLTQVLDGSDNITAHALLSKFFSGYPVENLRQLLHSESEHSVRIGVWIASELGARAEPLIDDLVMLLTHPVRYVRFFALDSILGASTIQHGNAVAAAIHTIRDPDEAVRWKALNFLTRASEAQLSAGLALLSTGSEASLTSWLLACSRSPEASAIRERLQDSDSIVRLFAAAAAARMVSHDPSVLKYAAESKDVEVRKFAEEQLQAVR